MFFLGSDLAALYWLKCEFFKNDDRWFSVAEVSSAIRLSRERTRRHLSVLALKRLVDTKVEGWSNVYRYRK